MMTALERLRAGGSGMKKPAETQPDRPTFHARKEIEVVLPARQFAKPPSAGSMVATRSGKEVLLVTTARRIRHNGFPDMWRIFGVRVATSSLPADAQAQIVPSTRSRSTSRPPTPREPRAITTPAQAAKAQREKIVALKREHRADGEIAVPAIRIGRTAVAGTWRDPHDTNVNRRFPKEITGHRAVDNIQFMLDTGCINKPQANAARRFRSSYERGVFGASVVSQFESQPKKEGPACGPGDAQMFALEAYRQARDVLGARLYDVVHQVIILGEAVSSYADRLRLNRSAGSERLRCALDLLVAHFEVLDEQAKAAAG
jgi:Domain of unknown function (DUF6456)